MPSELELAPPEVRYESWLFALFVLLTNRYRALWHDMKIAQSSFLSTHERVKMLAGHPSWANTELVKILRKCMDVNHKSCSTCRLPPSRTLGLVAGRTDSEMAERFWSPVSNPGMAFPSLLHTP